MGKKLLTLCAAIGLLIGAVHFAVAQVGGGVYSPSGLLYAQDGSATAPSVTFQSDPDTGFFSQGANVLGFTLGGTSYWTFAADQFKSRSASKTCWTSGTASTTSDLCLARVAAGVVGVGASSSNTTNGEMRTTTYSAAKISDPGTAPGAALVKIIAVAGTNAGSCKLVAYAGTSTTPVTIVDNVGSGC